VLLILTSETSVHTYKTRL